MAYGLTYGDVGNAFKIFYDDELVEGFFTQSPMLARWEKRSDGIVGKYAMFDMETIGFHAGVQALPTETSGFPRGGTPEDINPYVQLKRLAATGEISTEAIKRSSSKAGAWADQMERVKKGILRDYRWDTAVQLYGEGDGKRGYCFGTGGDKSALMDDGIGNVKHFIKPGMEISWLDATNSFFVIQNTANTQNYVTVTSQTTGTTVYWTESVDPDVATNDIAIKRKSTNADESMAATAWYEIMGLTGHVKSTAPAGEGGTTYQNITRATYTALQAQEKTNSGTLRAITFDVMQEALDACLAVGNTNPTCYMNLPVYRELAKQEVAEKRYPNTTVFKGGFKSVEWEGTQFFVDPMCPRTKIFMCDDDTFKIYQLGPPEPWAEDGNIFRPVYNAGDGNFSPVIQTNYIWWSNTVCLQPFVNLLLSDLEESSTTAITSMP